MEIINNAIFIYILLTTTCVSSLQQSDGKATQEQVTSNKCNLSEIIKLSKHVKECTSQTSGVASQAGMDLKNADLYLCKSIYETLDTICDLHETMSMTLKQFETDIESLKPLTKNKNIFCSAMQEVYKNKSYIDAINSKITPTVVKVNEKLSTTDCEFICWSATEKSYSLCNVLLWANRLLVVTKTRIDVVVVEKTTKISTPVANVTLSNLRNDHVVNSSPKEAENAKDVELTAEVAVKIDALTKRNKTVTSTKMSTAQATAVKSEILVTNEPKNTDTANDNPAADHNDSPDLGAGDKVSEILKGKTFSEISPANASISDKDAKPDGDDKSVNKALDGPINDNDLRPDEEDDNVPIGSGPDIESPLRDGDIELANTADSHAGLGQEESPDDEQIKAVHQKNIIPQENISPYQGPPDPPQHFFAYFMMVSFVCLACYLVYHKKHKIMGIIFEGRKSRGGRGRRRPNTAGYRKLDCNLEEAVTSQCNSNVTHVIY